MALPALQMSPPSSPLISLFRREASQSRLDELCEFAPAEGEQEELVFWFTELARWLRPARGQRGIAKIRFFEHVLTQHPDWRKNVATAFGRLIEEIEIDRLLAYGGIPSEFHFAGAVKEWLVARTLPMACKTKEGAQVMSLAFLEQDLRWLGRAENVTLFRSLLDEPQRARLEKSVGDALVDLAHQIVAQAHSPGIRSLAQAERSPFKGLFSAVAALNANPEEARAFNEVRGRARQCVALIGEHRAELVERGADLNTTFQLVRTQQQLERLILLADLRHDASDAAVGRASAALVASVLRHRSGKKLFRRSSDLLVQNLVDTAAHVGRKYLSDETSSWRAAFLAGAGGGALMAVATIVKYLLMSLHLPTFYEGVVFSLNYGAAFCAAYLLHFTIATKLPAHTAAALARSVQADGGHRARLSAFSSVWGTLLRLQLAGLVGNIVVAAPLAFALDFGALQVFGRHILTAENAEHMLHSNSVLGPSILFAAVTGLFLWISSLMGATGDNWTRIQGLADRLATNRHVMRRIGASRARSYAEAIVSRMGGLAGNLSLGFMLGLIPALLAIGSIPIEIRHVTVSTASYALALATGTATHSELVLAALGVAVIGIVNVSVSFALALWLAMRATGGARKSASSGALVWIGMRSWLKRSRRSLKPIVAEPVVSPASS